MGFFTAVCGVLIGCFPARWLGDVSGAIGLHIVTHMPLPQALLLQLTYVPGDCAKAIIATVVTLALRRRFPQLTHV